VRVIAGSAALDVAPPRAVVTVGTFDGVHVGHRAIMDTVVQRARALSGTAVVYTFDPHPRQVVTPGRGPGLLTTLDQKLELIAGTGVDITVLEPFTTAFSDTPPERFVRENLHARLRPVEVYVGYNFRFGHQREGSMQLLTELGPWLGFAVTIIPEVTIAEEDVSSTRIRAALAEGEVEMVARLLGRPYPIRGRVALGERRGRDIGFPTANLDPENEILPAPGVYAGRLRFLDDGKPAQGVTLPAVTNLGRRPTFDAGERIVAEAHLLDFTGDVYGRRVELGFEHRLRAEHRFPGVDALREQIGRDVAEARRRLAAPVR
jgi:riboflavin kinase/FMN adenylyltransferase